MAEIKQTELGAKEKETIQQLFLDEFLRYGKFTAGCNRVQTILDEMGKTDVKASTLVGMWIIENEEFRNEFEKAKKIVRFVSAEKVEEFLVKMGSGEQKTGKDSGMTTANPVAGHMFLEAVDPETWNPKEKKSSKKAPVIPRLEFHDHPGRPKKDKKNDSDGS